MSNAMGEEGFSKVDYYFLIPTSNVHGSLLNVENVHILCKLLYLIMLRFEAMQLMAIKVHIVTWNPHS
jgi:hypothetical protein